MASSVFGCAWCGRQLPDPGAVYAHIAERHPERVPSTPGAIATVGQGAAAQRLEKGTSAGSRVCSVCGTSLAGRRSHAATCSPRCKKSAQRSARALGEAA